MSDRAMKKQAPVDILVVCDSPAHKRPVAIAGYVDQRDGTWDVFDLGPSDSETVLESDRPASDDDDQWRGRVDADDRPNEADVRWRVRLVCRRCGRGGAQDLRAETLDRALTLAKSAGASRVSLSAVTAIVERSSNL